MTKLVDHISALKIGRKVTTVFNEDNISFEEGSIVLCELIRQGLCSHPDFVDQDKKAEFAKRFHDHLMITNKGDIDARIPSSFQPMNIQITESFLLFCQFLGLQVKLGGDDKSIQ